MDMLIRIFTITLAIGHSFRVNGFNTLETNLIRSIISTVPEPSDCSLVIWSSTPLTSDKLLAISQSIGSSMIFYNRPDFTHTFYPKFQKQCSFVLYYYLNNVNDQNTFQHDWVDILPGGLLSSYHVIFHQITTNSQSVAQATEILPLSRPLRLMLHQLFVISNRNSTEFKLFYSDIWGRRLFPLSRSSPDDRFFKDRSDLNGDKLIWASAAIYPGMSQAVVESYQRTRGPIHFLITPTVELSEAVNATAILRMVKSMDGTYNNATGKWGGIVGEVVNNNEAHITQPILMTKDRINILYLSVPFDTEGFKFITGPPKLVYGLTFLWQTYELSIWIAQFVLVGSIAVILKLGTEKSLDNPMSIFTIMIYVAKPAIDQSEDSPKFEKLLKLTKSRLLVITWLLSIIVLGSAFKTNMIATLTSPNIEYPPEDFSSLAKSKNYKIVFLQLQQTAAGPAYAKLKSQGHYTVTELEKRIGNYHTTNPDECVIQTQFDDTVCLGVNNLMFVASGVNLSGGKGEKLFRDSKDNLVSFSYVYGITKQLPHIVERFNNKLYRFIESGLLEFFVAKFHKVIESRGKSMADKRKLTGTEYPTEIAAAEGLRPQFGMFNAIITLAIGFGLAVLGMVGEQLIVKNRARNDLVKPIKCAELDEDALQFWQ